MSDRDRTAPTAGIGLTKYTKFSGCGAKLGPGVLEKALCGLAQPAYPEMLADFTNCEDAGLYDLGDGRALVQTVDFFPPIVDDPFLFGRIAAANALSDVYAMGGRPISALALVCFPVKALGLETLRAAMDGGLEALIEAGCALLGGHSIDDPEPKLGYAVTGLVDPAKAWRNGALEPGAVLILTKPLGTGLVNMACRAGLASEESRRASEASMARLNKRACELLGRRRVLACTDVTGFGLAGHAAEMAAGPACGLRLSFGALRFLPGAAEYAAMGLVPEGTGRNKEGRMHAVRLASTSIGPVELDLLFDPQTSGGLLAAVDSGDAEAALADLKAEGMDAAIVGEACGPSGVVEIAD
jgi:selenide, water dikinase